MRESDRRRDSCHRDTSLSSQHVRLNAKVVHAPSVGKRGVAERARDLRRHHVSVCPVRGYVCTPPCLSACSAYCGVTAWASRVTSPHFHPLPPTSRNTNGRSSRRKTGHFHAVKSRDRGDIQLSLSKLKTLEGRPDDEVRANAIDPLAARDDGATMLRLTPFHRCLIHSLRATVAEARAVQNCAQGQTVASHRFWPKLVPKKTSLPKFWDIVLPK